MLLSPIAAPPPVQETTGALGGLVPEPLASQLVEAFGRTHPMLVHFPIALLVVAGVAEFLRVRRDGTRPSGAALLCLTLGALGAALSAWSGWTWAAHDQPGRSVARIFFLHRWGGVGVASIATLSALLAWGARWSGAALASVLYRVTLLLSVGLVAVVGHLGGTLVHGDFLDVFEPRDPAPAARPAPARPPQPTGALEPGSPPASEPGSAAQASGSPAGTPLDAPPSGAPDGSGAPGDPGAAAPAGAVDFAASVEPILAARCVECHGPKKKKAGLRLDLVADLFAGEPDGWVVVPGDPEASALYQRITLPDEDPDRMPSKGERLSDEQIATIRAWIEEGARWQDGAPPAPAGAAEGSAPDGAAEDAPLGEGARVGAAQLPGPSVASAAAGAPEADVPPADEPLPVLDAAGEAALVALARRGALAAPIAAGSPLVEVSFELLGEEAQDPDLALLAGLEPNLVRLDLSRTAVGDAALARLARCTRLEHLELDRTAVGDAGLAHLAGLPRLAVLNLYGTRVTDAGLAHLATLPRLRRLYLWQTPVTDPAIADLRARLPELAVIGDELAPLAVLAAAIAAERARAFTVPCCDTAAAAGTTCTHPCCIEASAAGQPCASCRVEVAAVEPEPTTEDQ